MVCVRLIRATCPHCWNSHATAGGRLGEAMWRLLLSAGDGFGIDAPEGGLAGAVILTRYPPGLAVIGMLLVASRHGRRGLGRWLMQHALACAPGQVVYLHATPGRPLYERLGFAVIDTVTRHIGEYQPGPAETISDIERGIALNLRAGTLDRIAGALGLVGPVRAELPGWAAGRVAEAGEMPAGAGPVTFVRRHLARRSPTCASGWVCRQPNWGGGAT